MASPQALQVFNSFVLTNSLSQLSYGYQGTASAASAAAAAAASAGTPVSMGTLSGITLSGLEFTGFGTLATATGTKIYDSSVNLPATFNYLWIWCDQNFVVQLITSATNVALNCVATVPFCMSTNTMLAAASTSAISTSAPSTTAIAKIYLGNYSGNTMNYQVSLIL